MAGVTGAKKISSKKGALLTQLFSKLSLRETYSVFIFL